MGLCAGLRTVILIVLIMYTLLILVKDWSKTKQAVVSVGQVLTEQGPLSKKIGKITSLLVSHIKYTEPSEH